MCYCDQPRRTNSRRSSRRTRTRIRKPKYLSLRHQLAALPDPFAMTSSVATPSPGSGEGGGGGQQLDLFPLHPENLDRPDPHVASLLEVDGSGGGGGGPTLSDLLGSSVAGSETTSQDPAPSSPSMSNIWQGEMARRALRGRERWEFCCSSSSTSSEQEEASSLKGGGELDLLCRVPQGLSLKLDYKEILTAWSDRGSLYIEGEAPQVVPELINIPGKDLATPATVFVDVGYTGSTIWRVPDAAGGGGRGGEEEGKVEWSSSSREARVMRYKEKRHSRLFSKRIRYQVRKLNAEKRPRVKGRFVKRTDDV